MEATIRIIYLLLQFQIAMLLYFVSSVLLYQFAARSVSSVDVALIPADDYDDDDGNYNNQTRLTALCLELECPELRCQKVIQKEGECCKSCDISG